MKVCRHDFYRSFLRKQYGRIDNDKERVEQALAGLRML
jgi:hypothetical protein